MAACCSLQLSDLRRLLWLLRDCDRPCFVVRLSPAHKFQPSLSIDVVLGFLDPMAHLVVSVAAQLFVHTPGGQSAWKGPYVSQFDDCNGPWWALARRRL